MALTNNLKKQVDQPVWEWCRMAPGVSNGASSAAAANNSTYHVNHGRYIYYMQGITTVAGATSVGSGFWRYDTVSDTYQQLAFPPLAPSAYSGMQFVGGHGYYGRVISGGINTITCAALTGQTLKSYDIRITGGTGMGQHRTITNVADPVVADNGTLTTLPTTPETSVIDANKNWAPNQWVGYQVRFVAATGNSVVRKILYNSSTTLYFSDNGKYAEELNAYAPIVTIAGSALTIGAVGTQYQIESSVVTVDAPWTTQPDATSRFIVHSGGIWMISSGTTYTMQYYDIAADTWYVRNSGNATSPVTAVGTDGTIVNTGEIACIDERGTATGSQTSTTLQDTSKSWTTNYFSSKTHTVRIFSGTGSGQTRSITSNTSNTLTVSQAWTTTPDSTSQYLVDELDSGTASTAATGTQTGASTGSISGTIFTAGSTTGTYYPGQILSGTGVQVTTPIITASGACYTATAVTTVVVAYGGTTGIVAGMYVTIVAGTGTLAGGTQVSSVTATTVVLSAAPSVALSNATLQFVTQYVSGNLTSSSNGTLVTVGSTTGLYPGMIVSVAAGTGVFTVGTYVTQVVNATTFYVNATPSTPLSSATVLGQPYQTIIKSQLSGIPGGAGTYSIWPPQNVASTTITGTGIPTLTDYSKTWLPGRWNNQSVRIIGGTGSGQVRSIINTVSSSPAGTVIYTSVAGATSSGATITVTSTTNLVVGMVLSVTAGTGSFAFGTTVTAINGATTFTASASPSVALSGGASVVTGSLGYVSNAGATSSGTTITVNSTLSLVIGMTLNVTSGLGAFAFGTTVKSIDSATTFTASSAPTTALSGGASVVAGTSMNTLTVTPAWTTTPDATSVYLIQGDSDKLYFSLATQTPTFIHNVDSDMVTQGRALETGVVRGVSAQYADHPALAISSGVPVSPINYIFGTGLAYLSAAGATSSGTLVTVGTTAGLFVGCPVTVSAGVGSFATGAYVSVINSSTTFTVSATPVTPLSGGLSVVSGVASALAYHGIGPFTTTGLSGTGATATATFTAVSGSTYSGTTTIPVNSLITIMGALPVGYNGTFVVTASSAGSVSWASATSGAQTQAGIISSGAQLSLGSASVTVGGCVPTGYNSASINTIATAAGFVAYANVTTGQLTSAGYVQHLPIATTACTIASTTATITHANTTYFPVGSWVSVVGTTTVAAGTGSYNGVFQVTASSAGSVSFTISTNTPSGTASVQGTIQLATQTQLITTVNSHNFKAGQTITHSGDTHPAAANTNITTTVTPITVPGTLTQYTYSLGSNYAGTQIVYPQATTVLIDATKNWIPNQWANCLVTYNSTQGSGAGTNPTILTAYILANTANKLIFAGAQSAAPVQGISRYVITLPSASVSNSMVGTADSGLAFGVQSTTQLQDNTKFWAMPSNGSFSATPATSGANNVTLSSITGIYAGMTVVVTQNTAGSITLPSGTTVSSISGLVVTFSNTMSGTTGNTTFNFVATATSSGNTVTIAGCTTQGLQVGMYLGVNSIDNIKNTTSVNGSTVVLPVTGAFVANGGTVLTNVQVTAITGISTFTVSSALTTPLVNANIFASFWFTSQWNGRRVRLTTGSGTNFLEAAITGTTNAGILTFGALGSAPVSGVTSYAILQQPNRGLGTALFWNFGQTDYALRAKYLFQARGGGVTGFDRLNLQNDYWEFLTPTPNFEVLTTGAMYAYDGGDRIYFTPQVTQRVYYLEISTMTIHGASQYPYVAGTAMVGNRMEIFSTEDGLKFLWLNRHQFQECFKLLLFF